MSLKLTQLSSPPIGATDIPWMADESIPRLIINQEGIIIFCNRALYSLLKDQHGIEGEPAGNIFTGLNHKKNGAQQIYILHNNTSLTFQIDSIPQKTGEVFTVASLHQPADYRAATNITSAFSPSASIDYTTLANLSFDAVCISSLDGIIESANSNFLFLFGFDTISLQGKLLESLITTENRALFHQNLLPLQNGQLQTTTFESFCLDKNGSLKWIEWKHCRTDKNLYSCARDLTPLKNYQVALQKQKMKLAEAEAIGHIGQWEWRIGNDRIIFSDQLYQIFGVHKGVFIPTLNSINAMIDRRDSGRMEQVFQRAIIEQNDYDMDFRITRPDGEIRYIRCEGRCEIDDNDDAIALYGIMQDITLNVTREQEILKAKESVERAYAAKSQFLANMSHELRTPLNAVIGFSEMIERQLLGPIGNEKYLEYISGIRKSGEHLLDLISDILDMSKIEAGKYELHLEKFNISKIIRMAAHMMEGRALDANIKINLSIEDDALIVVADRRAIMQVILNLLSNAVKFSHQDGQVNVSLIKNKNSYSIIVKDEGVGIPANKLADITLPFEQADAHLAREYEGSGLGLAITKELTEMHGGHLYIESILGQGTTVTLKLPYEAK